MTKSGLRCLSRRKYPETPKASHQGESSRRDSTANRGRKDRATAKASLQGGDGAAKGRQSSWEREREREMEFGRQVLHGLKSSPKPLRHSQRLSGQSDGQGVSSESRS